MLPLVGIAVCELYRNGQFHHTIPARYAHALHEGAGALPILLPPIGEAAMPLLALLDGLLLSGSPSNVEPRHYGEAADLTPDMHDSRRDATTLPLIREALRRGLPLLGICRGMQEMNVALGGTLHQCLHDLPDRADHRGGDGEPAHRYRPKHKLRVQGALARLLGRTEITVNSVHGQGMDRLAPNLAAEATAPDGTIEAVRVVDAQSFAFGVQWHPEWAFADNEDSMKLLRAFGEACRARAAGAKRAA